MRGFRSNFSLCYTNKKLRQYINPCRGSFAWAVKHYLEKPKKIDNMSDAIHTRDPFASLSQKNSKKVLSPYRKLPKLAIALPPRLSLNSKKSARILDERSPQEKNFQENPKNNCNIINEEKKRSEIEILVIMKRDS